MEKLNSYAKSLNELDKAYIKQDRAIKTTVIIASIIVIVLIVLVFNQ